MSGKKLKLSMASRRAINGYMFIMPWLIGFVCFYVICIAMTVRFSLSELNLQPTGGYTTTFVGLANFVYAFRAHATFKQVFVTSMGNMVIDVPLIIFFSLFMSMMLNRKFKGRGLVRAIFFLPVILGADAISEAMQRSMSLMNGGLSSMSSEMSTAVSGGMSISYYMDIFADLALPPQVLEYLVDAISRISDIISASGVQIIIFIAALQSIPGSLYEVSRIEGATGYETFWKVTFPMVMPHIITNTVYTIVMRFSESEVIDLAYTTTFTLRNYGLGAVFSLISTLAVCLLLVVVVGLIQKRAFYYN